MSSIVANDGMALPADGFGHQPGTLKTRIVSALVLAPAALLAIFAGGAWFAAGVMLVAGAMAWEWRRLCTGGKFDLAGWLFCAGAPAAVAALPLWGLGGAAGIAALAAVAVGAAALAGGDRNAAWSVAGVAAVALAGIALVWLRAWPVAGLQVVLWLVVAVWFTDCCAYFAGRRIGGPKLAPVVSPNKTWAGLAGGMVGAAGWSAAYAALVGLYDPLAMAGAGAAVAVVAQAGDLGVSKVKRRFGAKDSGHLIPGHGGVLDRIDGLMLSAPMVMIALLCWSQEAGQ